MTTPPDAPAPARRELLVQAAVAVAGTGCMLAAWPLVASMSPNPGTPGPETREVDLAQIAPGESRLVRWRGLPVFVRHRREEDIARARAVAPGALKDTLARVDGLPQRTPATDENRTLAGHERWLVVVGLCTHMNCALRPRPSAGGTGDTEAFVCPCHASRFDHAGRVVAGPAPTNLAVPPYRFASPTRLVIGERDAQAGAG